MERITLNIIPKGITPVCHASQFDIGRVIRCDIMDNLQGYVFSDETVELRVCKPDNNIVTTSVDVVSGDTFVLIETTEQMTACDGVNKCELRIMKGNVRIGSLNFDMKVEVDPLKDGVESETVIHNLESMVDEMVAEDVAEQYDSANVIFDTEPTDNHGIGYTVTSEGIKTAIDNAFDYDNTASGSLVHITDGADNIPVKSLVSQIVAVETGNGQPKSPENPYTISGFDNGVITRCGKNLWSEGNLSFTTSQTVNFTSPKSALTISGKWQTEATATCLVIFYNGSTEITRNWFVADGTTKSFSYNFTTPITSITFFSGDNYVNSNGKSATITDFQIEVGNTATTFEPYTSNTYTFTFGQNIFGGHFNNKGGEIVNYGVLDLGSLNWYYSSNGYFECPISIDCPTVTQWAKQNGLCDVYTIRGMAYITNSSTRENNSIAWYSNVIRVADNSTTDATTFKNALSGKYLFYELATPRATTDGEGNLVITWVGYNMANLTWSQNLNNQSIFNGDLPSRCKTRLASSFNSTEYIQTDSGTALTLNNSVSIAASTTVVYCHDERYTNVADFKNGVTALLIYELDTPITLSITSQDIPTLLGENNIFSNCGDVKVNYYTDKSNDILEFIDSEIGKKNGTNIPIEENSQDSIKDYIDDEVSSTKDYVDSSINAPIKVSEVHAFTSLVGTTWEEGCYYIKRNGLVIVHISLQGLTANARNDIFTFPTDCKPSNQIVGAGRGGSSYTAFAQASVTTNGQLQISSVDTYAKIHFMYYVDE